MTGVYATMRLKLCKKGLGLVCYLGAFSVIMNLRMELFEALVGTILISHDKSACSFTATLDIIDIVDTTVEE